MSRTRTDGNQKEIIEKWMKIPGTSYVDLHNVRNGCPDLLLGYGGVNVLVEVKSEKGKLTPAQEEWHATWTGDVFIVRSFVELLYRFCSLEENEMMPFKVLQKFKTAVLILHGIDIYKLNGSDF